jgi:hypothetical protein
MNKDEDCICFYRDAVIAGHDDPAAVTMRRFNPMGCSNISVATDTRDISLSSANREKKAHGGTRLANVVEDGPRPHGLAVDQARDQFTPRPHVRKSRTYASSQYGAGLDGHSSRAHGAGSCPR